MNLAKQIPILFLKRPDLRINSWVFSGGFTTGIIIPICYIYTIYVLLPRYMQKRKAYSFKTFLNYYNVFQICANSFLLCFGLALINNVNPHILIYSCSTKYTLTESQKYWGALCAYYNLTLKIIDLMETVMFSLRKKESQITTLHVYHHVSVIWLGLIGLQNYTKLHIGFTMFLNQFVHIIMYSYYLSTNLTPPIRKFFQKLKRYLTTIQMIQFVLILCHLSQLLLMPECDFPTSDIIFVMINTIIYLYLFYDFYKKSYAKQNTVKQK